jgi:DUF1365 family protein
MNQGHARHKRYAFSKHFHVSPFMEMALDYDWRFAAPGEQLAVHMQNLKADELHPQKVFDATLVLNRLPITGINLARVFILYPAMTMKVTAGIYYQALKLWLKGVPFHDHPKHTDTPHRESDSNTTNSPTAKEAPDTAL